MRAAAAGILYFALVFAAGFALGAVRVGLVARALGDLAATLIELPIILALSWVACLTIIRRLGVEARIAARLSMGLVAFSLLILSEIALGIGLMSRSLEAQIEAMTAPPAILGLGGQAIFGLFPLIALRFHR